VLHWRPSYLAVNETSSFASLARTRFALFSLGLPGSYRQARRG
jgi:hypothetical protein